MRIFGALLFVIGLITMAYFMFSFSNATADASEPGKMSVNLGLMNDRDCGCICGAALTIAGAVIGGYPKEEKA